MSAPQGPNDKPSAPYGNDLPPPYSAVVGGAQQSDAAPAAYPQMGFVTGPAPGQTVPPNTYPHPAPGAGFYPHPAPGAGVYPYPAASGSVYSQQPGVMPGGVGHTQVPMNVIMAPPVGTEPVNTYCASCSQQITTKVDYRTSWHTHLIAGIICFSTMFFSMCCLGLVPYCMDSCKNAEHYCPNCNAYIGKYERC